MKRACYRTPQIFPVLTGNGVFYSCEVENNFFRCLLLECRKLMA
jgi:hypothetical protein